MAMEKAKLSKFANNKGVAPILTVLFNPKDLSFSKQNTWNAKKTPKQDTPELEFSGGGTASLKLQLFFDTFIEKADVRKKYLNHLVEWTRVDPKLKDSTTKKGRPPEVRFQWGHIIFDGVIQSLNQRLTLFLPENGVPVRAVVDLTLSETRDDKDFKKQNPTSGALAANRVWIVRDGDTLPWIAYCEYRDATEWRVVADANNLHEVRRLVPGTTLLIPNV
jgi:hypothetical protein